ncbi:MAG TPA: hypothetical protein VFO79_11235 [Xanthomonadales bacterium]|nr:hypothetical protein [Xanthomonadales bacterium]
MGHVRCRRLRAMLAVVVTVALLCAQAVLAQHVPCTGSPQSAAAAGQHEPDCAPAGTDALQCEAHCSQGDLSHDATRTLGVPMLGPVSFVRVALLVSLPQHGASTRPAPPRSWHRPTPHPASVLLI